MGWAFENALALVQGTVGRMENGSRSTSCRTYDGSHISPFFIDWEIQQNIILYVLPPHIAQILQLLVGILFFSQICTLMSVINSKEVQVGLLMDTVSV